MINGKVSEFVEELSYQDHYANYKGQKYFFNGCQCQCDTNGKIIAATLEIYNLTTHQTVFTTTQEGIEQCIDTFENAKIFDGKTFWDVEKEMEWVDE